MNRRSFFGALLYLPLARYAPTKSKPWPIRCAASLSTKKWQELVMLLSYDGKIWGMKRDFRMEELVKCSNNYVEGW